MKETGLRNGAYGADKFGFKDLAGVHWNLPDTILVEHAIPTAKARSCKAARSAPRPATTPAARPRTSTPSSMRRPRTPCGGTATASRAKSSSTICSHDFIAHAKGKTLFAQDLYGGADPQYRIKARVFTELAWHSLFIRQLLIRPERAELASYVPDMTIVDMPSFKPDAKRHGGRDGSDTMVAIDFTRKIVLICGSSYAGEMKKSVFTTLNFYLPAQGVMPMHCSANVGKDGDVALFFGLSGTGKTTLSADPNRTLIGDDEHGWSENGVFNFEGGCYAKMHQAVGGSRAGNLRRDQPLRRRAGKRRVRSGDAASAISTATSSPKTPARPIRSSSCRWLRRPAAPASRRTSSS